MSAGFESLNSDAQWLWPFTMAESISILPLEDCFQRIIRINHAIKAPKEVAELYAAAVGLFCHLKKEQRILYR